MSIHVALHRARLFQTQTDKMLETYLNVGDAFGPYREQAFANVNEGIHEAIRNYLDELLPSGEDSFPLPGKRKEALKFTAACVKLVFCNERSSWEVWVKIEFGLVNHMANPGQNAFFELLEGTRAKLILVQSEDFESHRIFRAAVCDQI